MIIIKDKFKVLPVSLLLLCTTVISAHPGSGIVVDSVGQVYFTDTGKGVWKLGTQGELTFLPASNRKDVAFSANSSGKSVWFTLIPTPIITD